MSPSTAHLEALPDLAALRRLAQSLAMLDAIICPDWEPRYYSYNVQWGEGEEMASMRNGCGDDWFVLFDRHGAALKGMAREPALARDPAFAARIQQTVPADFGAFLREPAFSMDRASFCLWRRHEVPAWSVVSPVTDGGPLVADDGSAELLRILDADPQTYHAWAEAYYECELPITAVQAIYRHQPLDDQLVASLNPELTLAAINADAGEIGYPRA